MATEKVHSNSRRFSVDFPGEFASCKCVKKGLPHVVVFLTSFGRGKVVSHPHLHCYNRDVGRLVVIVTQSRAYELKYNQKNKISFVAIKKM